MYTGVVYNGVGSCTDTGRSLKTMHTSKTHLDKCRLWNIHFYWSIFANDNNISSLFYLLTGAHGLVGDCNKHKALYRVFQSAWP